MSKLKIYSNSFLYCAIVSAILYMLPAIRTAIPPNITIINHGLVARSDATKIEDVPASAWKKVQFPYAIPEVGKKKGSVEWIQFEYDDSKVDSDFVGVLIEDLPHGGTIYLDGKLKDILPSSDETNQILNGGINGGTVLINHEKDPNKSLHTIAIRSNVAFSYSLISEVLVGDYFTTQQHRNQLIYWNFTVLSDAKALCICVAGILLFLIASNWRNKRLQGFLSLASLWPLWITWSRPVFIPYEWWTTWRIALWFVCLGLIFSVTSVAFSLIKEKIPPWLKWYYIGAAALAAVVTIFNDEVPELTASLVFIQTLGLVYIGPLILKLAIERRSFLLFSMFLYFCTSCLSILHDCIYWLGGITTIYPSLIAIGVPRYFLQTHTITHLVVFPTICLVAYEAIKAIKRSFEMQYELKNAAQKERSKITRDLHDSLGATLTMANIQALNGSLTVDSAKLSITHALNELRLILNGFNETSPSLAGIIETVVEQARKELGAKRTISITYNLPYSEDEPLISQAAGMNLSRITREAITNAVKHSKCTEISLNLHYLGTDIMLEIMDNGQGFEVSGTNSDHKENGLRNMHFRAEEVGGKLTINSAPGNTLITLFIPTEDEASNLRWSH